jgi:hypothetical protein
MIGVTIGVGPMIKMARRAARSFEESCEMPVQILGDEQMRRCRLTNNAWLKFHIFDIVDSESIVYFDADTITRRNYFPQQFANSEELIAVRDVPSYFTRRDARMLGFPIDRCMNGGWFIANRAHHSAYFLECKRACEHFDALLSGIAPGIPLVNEQKIFYDQPILNLLAYRTNIPMRFIDRRYNYLGYGRGNLWAKLADIFVPHFARGLRPDYYRFSEKGWSLPSAVWHIDERAFKIHSGKWRHVFKSEQTRDVMFRPDGTIGGWPELNYWFVTTAGELIMSEWDCVNLSMKFESGRWGTLDSSLTLERV